MPFGKFQPAKSEETTDSRGRPVVLNTVAGYGGIFWGTVYDSNGNIVDEDDFTDLAENTDDDCKYWDMIDEFIHQHCLKYIDPHCGGERCYQSGFGGKFSSGLIDFWTKDPIPEMPDMPFEIEGKKYVMKWYYDEDEEDED